LVQKAGFTNDTAATVSQAFASSNAAGNLLVALVVSIGADGYDVTGVSDSQGNVWMQAGRTATANSIWYMQNCKAGPNAVTISKSGSVSRGFIAVAEFAGAAQTGIVLDQTTYGQSATSGIASDTLQLRYPGALIVAMFNSNSSDENWTSPTSGFDIEAGANDSFAAWADNVNSVQGQNPFQVTLGSVSDAWDLKMAAFLPAVLPAPTPGYNFIRTSESVNKALSPVPGTPSQVFFPGGNNAGDLLLVVCNQFFPTADQVSSVTDTAGNTYSPLYSQYDSSLMMVTDVFAANGSVGTNIRNTIACNFDTAGIDDSVDAVAIEYSGQAAGGILDTSAYSFSTTGNSLSYSITPAVAGELLFTVNVTNSGPNEWSGLGIETDREPSIGNSNNETRIADLLYAPSGASTITVTRATIGLVGFTLALKAKPGATLKPSNLSATINPNPVDEFGTVTVDGSLPGVAGMPAPTGTFSIDVETADSSYSSSTEFGNGPPSLSVDASRFAVGPATVQVSYGGDVNYAPANLTLSLMITVPFTVNGTAVTIAAPGVTTGNTSTITVSPLGAFVGAVDFLCSLQNSSVPVGAQFLPTCAVPASANVSGSAPLTVAMTISSTASGANALFLPPRAHEQRIAAYVMVSWLFGLVFLAAPPRRGQRRLLLTFLFAVVGTMAACGGSGGNQSPGTTPGTYTFVVNATVPGPNSTALFSANTNVTVTIQ
jgi:hypothetical protein